MTFPEELVVQAIRLAAAGGIGFAGLITIIIVGALATLFLKRFPKGESGPPPHGDGGGGDGGPSGPGVPLPTDPDKPGGEFPYGG